MFTTDGRTVFTEFQVKEIILHLIVMVHKKGSKLFFLGLMLIALSAEINQFNDNAYSANRDDAYDALEKIKYPEPPKDELQNATYWKAANGLEQTKNALYDVLEKIKNQFTIYPSPS